MDLPQTTRRTTHRLIIDAPGELIFRMLRDSSHWPYLEGLTVYSERVSGDDSNHELRTSVVSNGSLNSSHCHRIFDAAELRAEFRQLGLESPLLRLGGGWAIRRSEGSSEVTLDHEFEVDNDAGVLAELIHRSLDEYSRRELEALRLSCERLTLLLQQHIGTTVAPAGVGPGGPSAVPSAAREA
ncbi:SRPBCC family protein [Arthrobacter sp. UYCu723]